MLNFPVRFCDFLKMFCASFCFHFWPFNKKGSNNKIMLDFVEICRKKKKEN